MNVIKKVYSGPFQAFRVGLAFPGIIFSTLDGDLV